MFEITYAIEPNRLMLIWQSGNPIIRKRFVVGELIRAFDKVCLSYNYYTEDFYEAVAAGFTGHPAFKLDTPVHHYNVVEVFSRRLPARNRADFSKYLQKHRLTTSIAISDFALLGYTGAALPGDGFQCAIDYRFETTPHLFLMEVAGFRYNAGMDLEISSITQQVVNFVPDDHNEFDPYAVRILMSGIPIGYVPRYYAKIMRSWLKNCMVMAFVERIDGTLTKPQVHVAVSVVAHSGQYMQKIPTLL
ncbi:HIRAN domain-containing protein [Sphingomonas sp. Xoc002]|uniref:HIRAN domain-containing protein n=1 Tax=Sphingomonas sp. Xoc002 TaxID=2837624 RepID=UPI003D166876